MDAIDPLLSLRRRVGTWQAFALVLFTDLRLLDELRTWAMGNDEACDGR